MSIGSLLSSAPASMYYSWLNNLEQSRVQGQYERATDQQIADALRVAGQVGPEGLSTYDASSGRGLSELFDLRNRQGQGYYDRYAAAEADIEGYGDQMKADIDAASERTAGENRLALQERGLYGATTAPDFNLRVERDRTAEQRRLGEDLTRQRVNLLSGLSGDALRADAGTSADIANWFGTDASNRAGLVQGGYGSMIDVLMGINRVPPPSIQGQQAQFGANAVQPAQPQGNWFTNLFGGAVPGIGAGVGYGLASGGGW